MQSKNLNRLQKLTLKTTDKEAYEDYKFLKKLQSVQTILPQATFGNEVHFKHSGNAGDIIYALPTIYTLSQQKSIHLHLNINEKTSYGKKHHPLGNIMLNEKMVSMLQPLLMQQPGVKTCDVFTNQKTDYDLDDFRKYPFNYRTGNIARWYFLIYGINADLSKPWLNATPDNSFNDAIVVARSHRYNAPGISYNFLNKYSRLVFVGTAAEYSIIKKILPSIEYLQVNNFLQMASIIAGCRFFIGNQSLPFAIAEALKVKRALEVYYQSPNVNVEGINGFDFCYQPQFEKIVSTLYAVTN